MADAAGTKPAFAVARADADAVVVHCAVVLAASWQADGMHGEALEMLAVAVPLASASPRMAMLLPRVREVLAVWRRMSGIEGARKMSGALMRLSVVVAMDAQVQARRRVA